MIHLAEQMLKKDGLDILYCAENDFASGWSRINFSLDAHKVSKCVLSAWWMRDSFLHCKGWLVVKLLCLLKLGFLYEIVLASCDSLCSLRCHFKSSIAFICTITASILVCTRYRYRYPVPTGATVGACCMNMVVVLYPPVQYVHTTYARPG